MKKGLSNVIVSVLLILLSISAIVIVWQVVKSQINRAQLSPSLCLNLEITIKSVCFNSASQEIEITLERKIPEKEIINLDFALNYKDKSEVYSCGEECPDCIIMDSSTKTYYIQANKPDSVSIKYESCLENKKVDEC